MTSNPNILHSAYLNNHTMSRHGLRSVQVSIIKVASRLPLTVISYTLKPGCCDR